MSSSAHRRSVHAYYPRSFWPWVGAVLAVATLIRLVNLATNPADDWDERNYLVIGRNFAENGEVMAKTPYGQQPETYFYNPVFYFWLLGGWFKLFGSGLLQARVLAALASVLVLLMLAALLRKLIGRWALLAVGLLAIDGWMVFTNRVGWIENLGFVFAIGGLWLYERALNKPTTLRFAMAGLALIWATVFKHQFGYFIVAALVCWIIVRKHFWHHVVMFGIMIAGGAAYMVAMLVWNANDYWRETWGQIERLLGQKASRGAVGGLSEVVTTLQNQYSIYFGMVVGLVIAGVLVAYRSGQIAWRLIRWRSWSDAVAAVRGNALLFAWAFSAYFCFGVTLKVRLPHYIFLVIVPAYCYLASEVRQYVEGASRQGSRRWVAVAALVAVIGASGFYATFQRMVVDDRNAFGDSIAWINQNVPADALVITEEPVGNNIRQPYCKMDRAASCEKAASYIVVYTTTTFKPPDSPAITRMISEGSELVRFEDFKALVRVIKLKSASG